MIFNLLYNLPNSTTGLDDILVQTITEVPTISSLLLVFVYFIVFLGGISRQKARSGIADYPMWSVIASISIFIIALIMSVISGLIKLDVLVIATIVPIFSVIWLWLDRKQGEN